MDTVHQIVVQPQFCAGMNGGAYGNNGYNNGIYGNGYNNGAYGANPNVYSPYCNQYGGAQPYYNPAGNYPMNGYCPQGTMQIFNPYTGATTCQPWSMYGQYAPYATPNYYRGSMWFYIYY